MKEGPLALVFHSQVSGQILQPSDLRIKDDVRELDTRTQLHNVKKLKIVQYVYRPEFLKQLTEDEKKGNNSI